MATQIWAICMTRPDDYNGFIVSRVVSGLFGSVVGVVGPRILIDMFFLHQRGRVFSLFHSALNFGIIGGPTFSAFFSAGKHWPVEYWWSVALLAVSAILMVLFVEETTFDRELGALNIEQPKSFIANRFATFLFGTRVVKKTTPAEVVSHFRWSIVLYHSCSVADGFTGYSVTSFHLALQGRYCSGHALPWSLYPDQLRMVPGFQYPHSGVPTETSQARRLRFLGAR